MMKLARAVALAAAITSFFSPQVMADPCKDLVDMAQKGLSMEGLDAETKFQLQELMDTGKSGNVARCDQVTGSIFQSSPEGERAPAVQRCSKTAETV